MEFKSTDHKARLVSGYDYDIVSKALRANKISKGEAALLKLVNFGLFDWYGSDAAMQEMQKKGWVEVTETHRNFAFSVTEAGLGRRAALFQMMQNGSCPL